MSTPERPRLIVVAGPNGTGKTSITEQLLRHRWMEGCEYINPDYIARDEFGDWNSADAVGRAARRGAAALAASAALELDIGTDAAAGETPPPLRAQSMVQPEPHVVTPSHGGGSPNQSVPDAALRLRR